MRRVLAMACAMVVVAAAGAASAQQPATSVAPAAPLNDDRPVFVLKSYTSRGYQVESREELKGIGKGLQVLVLALPLPEAECVCKELGRLQRLFILDGERVEMDSFVEDGIEDAIEPSVNTATFFNLKWSVTKTKPAMLVLTGISPQQSPGEKVRTAERTLVMSWTPEAGFEALAETISARPAIVGPADIRIPLK